MTWEWHRWARSTAEGVNGQNHVFSGEFMVREVSWLCRGHTQVEEVLVALICVYKIVQFI
jgi:hypothetical protein